MEEGMIGGALLAWASETDVGRARRLNEDALLAEPPLFAVADGMGGHDAGEVASALTIERLRTLAQGGPTSIDAVAAELHNVNSLLRAARTDGTGATMGTTGVGMALVEHGGVPSWLVFNVGDSRGYCLVDGTLTQVSHDHSYVQELVDAGELSPGHARTHPQRNVVTRALGADAEVRPDYWVRPVVPGERYLLCSDGLHGELDDGVIGAVLSAGLTAGHTVRVLVDLALEAGGRDNVTAVVVDVVDVEAWHEVTTETRPGSRRSGSRTAVLDPPAAGGGGRGGGEEDPEALDATVPIRRPARRAAPPPSPGDAPDDSTVPIARLRRDAARTAAPPLAPAPPVAADPPVHVMPSIPAPEAEPPPEVPPPTLIQAPSSVAQHGAAPLPDAVITDVPVAADPPEPASAAPADHVGAPAALIAGVPDDLPEAGPAPVPADPPSPAVGRTADEVAGPGSVPAAPPGEQREDPEPPARRRFWSRRRTGG